jgi:hypothetical protein
MAVVVANQTSLGCVRHGSAIMATNLCGVFKMFKHKGTVEYLKECVITSKKSKNKLFVLRFIPHGDAKKPCVSIPMAHHFSTRTVCV